MKIQISIDTSSEAFGTTEESIRLETGRILNRFAENFAIGINPLQTFREELTDFNSEHCGTVSTFPGQPQKGEEYKIYSAIDRESGNRKQILREGIFIRNYSDTIVVFRMKDNKKLEPFRLPIACRIL